MASNDYKYNVNRFVLLTSFLKFFRIAGILCALAVFVSPATVHAKGADSGTVITNNYVQIPAASGQFSLSYFRPGTKQGTDTVYAFVDTHASGLSFNIEQIFGDTVSVVGGDSENFDETYVDLTGRSFWELSVNNYSNGTDVIHLKITKAWAGRAGGGFGADTIGGFRYQFVDSRGVAFSTPYDSYGMSAGTIALGPDRSGTVGLRILTTGDGAKDGDTIRVIASAVAQYGIGTKARAYQGDNGGFVGDTPTLDFRYGGSGNDSVTLDLRITNSTIMHIAKADTVFSPISLSSNPQDTQHYIPGARVVYTVWFDFDGPQATDTVQITDWIDTRYLKFDTAGIRYAGVQYGSVHNDSAFPAGGAVNVRVAVAGSSGSFTQISDTSVFDLNSVAQVRWTISRNGGVLNPHDGDDSITSADTAPVAPNAASDTDMGYVRFSVIIK